MDDKEEPSEREQTRERRTKQVILRERQEHERTHFPFEAGADTVSLHEFATLLNEVEGFRQRSRQTHEASEF